MDEDLMLIEQVLSGDSAAYARVIDKYNHGIYMMLLRMIGQPQDAQDLTQEVFIKVFYRLREYKHTHKFSSWLYRIATNHCLDELRKRKSVQKIPLESAALQSTQTPDEWEGVFAKDIVDTGIWYVNDEKGNTYIGKQLKTLTIGHDNKIRASGILFVENLLHEPKELTLTCHTLVKQHPVADWKVPIELVNGK